MDHSYFELFTLTKSVTTDFKTCIYNFCLNSYNFHSYKEMTICNLTFIYVSYSDEKKFVSVTYNNKKIKIYFRKVILETFQIFNNDDKNLKNNLQCKIYTNNEKNVSLLLYFFKYSV